MIKTIFKHPFLSTLKNFLKKILYNYYFVKSYSQEGEDMILHKIFENQKNGFYIDVGAHHPKRFSNTFYFYQRGWRGINIDACPGSMRSFHQMRPKDINLEIPITKQKEKKIFYIFDEPALNSFSQRLSDERVQQGVYKIIDRQELESARLADVLNEYLPSNQEIDFLTIDAEGYDFEVLQSNDWTQYRPQYVLIEILEFSLERFQENPIYQYMKEQGYDLFAKSVKTVFFKRV